MTARCDVVVAGLGGAGSSVAWHLARRGLRRLPGPVRVMIQRATKLTASEITNSMSPVPMRASRCSSFDSGKLSARLAAIVCEFWLSVRMFTQNDRDGEMIRAIAMVSPSARPNPSRTALTTPERA